MHVYACVQTQASVIRLEKDLYVFGIKKIEIKSKTKV